VFLNLLQSDPHRFVAKNSIRTSEISQNVLTAWGTSGIARISQWGRSVLEDMHPATRSKEDLCDFSNFLIKIKHFYEFFAQNSYFKAITHQLQAFKISLNVINRINELQIL